MSLINDLVVNDDGIFEQDPMHVRNFFSEDLQFIGQIQGLLANADISNMQELQYRDTILRTIFRLHQLRPEIVGPQLKPVLYQHR